MTPLEKFATAALQGAASSALGSEFIAKRAWDIAQEMVRLRPPENKPCQTNSESSFSEMKYAFQENPHAAALVKREEQPKEVRPAKKNQPKIPLLEAIQPKGKTAKQLMIETGLSYAQVNYQLKKLQEKEEVINEKSGREHLWMLPKVRLAEEPISREFDRKLAFAKSIGYANISDAISKEGPFEFAEKFQNWKP